jgi:hypothetical protein
LVEHLAYTEKVSGSNPLLLMVLKKLKPPFHYFH